MTSALGIFDRPMEPELIGRQGSRYGERGVRRGRTGETRAAVPDMDLAGVDALNQKIANDSKWADIMSRGAALGVEGSVQDEWWQQMP